MEKCLRSGITGHLKTFLTGLICTSFINAGHASANLLSLPFDGNATPSTYAVDGKHYVVISAGGAKKKPVHGGSLVAFSLPD